MLPDSAREYVAPHVAFDRPEDDVSKEELVARAMELLKQSDLALPIVAKPDEGQRGVGVRPIYDAVGLGEYLIEYPKGSRVCLQALCTFREEAGLLYYRMPGEERGRITSVTLKEFLAVTGDGARTLRELILDDVRARYMAEVFFARHGKMLDSVIESGQRYPLVFAGNHKQGCVFRDGKHILTDALSAKIDEIARSIPGFYFGRFDIRYETLESFQRGESFTIIEVNGAGAEATHIWDPSSRLGDAYWTLFEQFRVLFEIGDANRKAGHRPLGAVSFLSDVWAYHRVARHYPSAE